MHQKLSSSEKIEIPKMQSSALVLTRENALKIADLLEKMPQDVLQIIFEFNVEHAQVWKKVMDSALRHVFCPSYFHALEEEAYFERMHHKWNSNELKFQFSCGRCLAKVKPSTVLFNLRFDARNHDGIDHWILCKDCEDQIEEKWNEEYSENEWNGSNFDFGEGTSDIENDIDESFYDF
jgi:hypothetical protein